MGFAFVIFTAFTGVLNWQIDKLAYSSTAPSNFIILTIVAAMVPYLVAAVVSFIVAYMISNATKSTDEKRTEAEPTQEVDLKQTEKEMDAS